MHHQMNHDNACQSWILNPIPTQSQHFRDTQLRLESTSQSILTKEYGTQWTCERLVVAGAMRYKRRMTVPVLQATLLHPITVLEVWQGSTNAHLVAENCSSRFVGKCTLEDFTWRVNKHEEKSQPDETKSPLSKEWYGHPDKWQQAQLENVPKTYLEESRWVNRHDMCAEHRWMSNLLTSAPTSGMICATEYALERGYEDSLSLIYAQQVQMCLLYKFWTGRIIISEHTK